MSIKRYRPRNTTVNKWGQITTTPAEAKAMIQAFEKSKMAELKAAGFRLPKRGKSSKPGKSAWNRH